MATPDIQPQAAKGPSRVFVGLKISPQIARELAHMARVLEGAPVKRVAQADIHLTLVPPWNESSLSAAAETLRRAVVDFGPLALEFMRLDYGPEPKRPRLLWAECAASDELGGCARRSSTPSVAARTGLFGRMSRSRGCAAMARPSPVAIRSRRTSPSRKKLAQSSFSSRRRQARPVIGSSPPRRSPRMALPYQRQTR